MRFRALCGALWLALLITGRTSQAANELQAWVRPLLREHCLPCHTVAEKQGELDLEQFDSMDRAKGQPAVWQRVLDQITNLEMPPKERPPLPVEDRRKFVRWIETMLDEVALAQAGDPGPVVLRRLSNAEYSYTVRDLTAVESLDPAREFPADGAAGEGFSNAGAALVMSPTLLTKYLDAAKEVAAHVVPLPDGVRFSPYTTPRDWTDETLGRIREFYSRYTDSSGATAVNLQGIKFDTNSGGRLPVRRYITALLERGDELRSGRATLDSVARARHLNKKYLTTLWQMLTGDEPSLLLDLIRQRFRESRATDAEQVVRAIEAWQQALWRFASVGHIGKVNGPRSWQEPVTPLVSQQGFRQKLISPAGGGDVTIFLSVGDAGDGCDGDYALWQNPRLVAPGRADVSLRDVRQGPSASGLDPELFGKHPLGGTIDPLDLCVQAPAVIEVRLPAALAEGAELVVTGKLDPTGGAEGSVQMQLLSQRPEPSSGIVASRSQTAQAKGQWTDNHLRTVHDAPIIVNDGSRVRQRFEQAFHDFRQIFPAALCYTKIVPVDEVVTLTLFYREDDHLRRLMLDTAQQRSLDRLWDELEFVSELPLKQVDVFEQLYQFATQDANPSAFEPLRGPIQRRAADFQKREVEAQPRQLAAVLDFAARAWRNALTTGQQAELRALYQQLRAQQLPHDAALRMVLVRVLIAPAFLYRGEKAAPGERAAPVSDWELATRLSYFLTASTPDEELLALAAAGRLKDSNVLLDQARRLLRDAKIRRLAMEFGCQWLQVRDLETLDEKSERHFPTFRTVRSAMLEETVRFFTDLFQNDRPVLSLLDADYTFVNAELARHYDLLPNETGWQRMEGLRALGRGGILGMASILARQSGASRTSPILRGHWISDVVLGEKLPRPPKGVPVLPDEAPLGLTERQLIERHSTEPKCASCHDRIDPLGFSLEGFDAIGRSRTTDTGGLLIDARARLLDGTEFTGLNGLRDYLLEKRRDDFLRQFCRKLLGYALGRGVQLADKPLLDAMLRELAAHDYRVSIAIELIVQSPQFRQVRGQGFVSQP